MDIVELLRQEIGGYTDKDIEKAEANMQEAANEIERLRKDAKRDAKYMLAFYRIRQTRGNEFMEAFDQAVRLYEDEQPAKATGEEVMDIVDDLRDLNSMHTPKEISDIGEKAADEIERLRGIINDDRLEGAADEIERLREQVEFERASLQAAFGELRKLDGDIERLNQQNAELLKALTSLYEACRWEKVAPEIDDAKAAIAKATGGE